MINISFKLSKRIALPCLVIFLGMTVMLFFAGTDKGVSGENDKERRQYIVSLGYTPSELPCETEQVVIPEDFSDVYEKYNAIQYEAGYDLKDYRSRSVVRYSYFLEDYDPKQYVVANLLVFEGKIIGGDISSRRLDGFMLPLVSKDNGQIG